MLTDTVFWASVVTIITVCIVVGYLGWFTVKHIKNDAEKHSDQKPK